MNSKPYILAFLLLSLHVLLVGQGFKFGGILSTMSGEYQDIREVGYLPGYQIGISTNLIREKPNAKMEFNYVVRGRTISGTQGGIYGDAAVVTIDYTDRLPYFDMPILFTYPFSDRLILEMGPNIAFRMWGKRKGMITQEYSSSQGQDYTLTHDIDASWSDSTKYLNNRPLNNINTEQPKPSRKPVKVLDIGFNIGMGFFITEKSFLSLRYHHGILDAFNNDYAGVGYSTVYEANRSLEFAITFYVD
jgi:hypothetical protein